MGLATTVAVCPSTGALPIPTTPSQSPELALIASMIEGLVKHQSDVPSLVLGSQTQTNAQLVQRLQQRVTNAKAVVTTHLAWQSAVAAASAQRLQDRQWLDDLKQTLRARFSGDASALGDFGLAPRKKRAAKPATKVAAAAKAKATREARGTKGKAKAAEITGNVTGVEITPVTVAVSKPSASPAPEPTPAPVAPAPAGTPSKS